MKITNREEFGWGVVLGVCSIVMILVAFFASGGMAAYIRAGIALTGGLLGSLAASAGINGIVDEHPNKTT